MNETKKPTVRFKGFSEKWEQRELSTIYRKIRNAFVGTATPFYVPDGHFYLESNNIKNGQINRNSEVFINDQFYYQQKDKWLHTNDMVMVQSGHVGHAAVIPEHLDKTAAHALITFTDQIDETEPYFLNYQYQTEKSIKKISDITKGNTIKHILSSDMKHFVVDIPSLDEQKQIALFFQSIDDLITIQHHKLKKLQVVKASMLEKMFPKNGADVPEIRFKGFAGAWEQRKLSDIAERVVRKNYNNESSLPLTISAQYGLVDQTTYFNNRIASRDISNYYLVLKGEFAYNKSTSDSFPFGAVKRLDLYEKGVLSTLYIVFRIKNQSETNSNYLAVFFDTDRWHKGVAERAAEGARNHGLLNISADDFLDIDLLLPRTEMEQAAIGRYFLNLDHLIFLQRQELDKLQSIKKALLEKMFV